MPMDTQVERTYAIDLSGLMKVNLRELTWLPSLMIVAVVVRSTIDINVLEWSVASYIAMGLSMLSFFTMAFFYLRQEVMSRYVFACVLFQTLLLASSIINGTDSKNCFYDGCVIIFVVMVCDYYRDRPQMIVVSFAMAFSLCVYLNVLHMIIHPDLWIVSEMKEDSGYLLGSNYNQMGCRLLCAVATSILCLKYSKWWWLNVLPIVLISTATLFIVSSMTSLTGLLLFLLFCLLPSNKLMKIGILALLAFVLFFQIFVCFQGKGIENNSIAIYFVEDVLGKDITFTNRTMLWDAASRVFADSPIYGYGYVDRDWYFSHMSSYAKGPHNYIWAMLIYGGILLLAVFTYLSCMVVSKIIGVADKYTLFIYASVAILFLMMTMEVYPPVFIIILLSLAYYNATLCETKE